MFRAIISLILKSTGLLVWQYMCVALTVKHNYLCLTVSATHIYCHTNCMSHNGDDAHKEH